ncbi:MAG: hypothetical protein JXK05_13665 [Campylobacterales bacterium]|nr:hypothetical protein [Campylobacterales bacterium]
MTALQAYIDELKAREEEITHLWLARPAVGALLQRYHIDSGFFARHFARRMFACAVGTIEGSKSEQSYPILYVFMLFFYMHKIRYAEILQLYNDLRRELVRVLMHEERYRALFDWVNDALDQNIDLIIEEVSAIRYDQAEITEVMPQLREVSGNVEVSLDFEMLDDLQENEGILLDAVAEAQRFDTELSSKMVALFEQYARLLQENIAFLKLSDAFIYAAHSIAQSSVDVIGQEQFEMIREYLTILCDELAAWREALGQGHIIEDTQSLISNLEFFARLFQPTPTAEAYEEEMEWF